MAKKKNAVRPDGRIAVQIYIGKDADGKRKYKTVYGVTQKEADEKALQIKLAMRKGLDIASARDTFSEWAERWLSLKACEVSNSQYNVYCSVKQHLNEYIENAPISKIKAADLQSIIISIAKMNPNTGKPASYKMLKAIKEAAGQIFRMAIENRVLDYNPATAIKIPSTPPPHKRRALTIQEQEWINNTDHRAKRAAMIMMYAGLRRGELIPLMWSDIDLERRTITISKAVEKIGGKFIIKNRTKTESGIRTIDIPQKLADFLKAEVKKSPYVCVNAKHEYHNETSWRKMWNSYLADLNIKYGDFSPFEKRPKSKFDPKGVPFVIPKITPHWLRHTYATMLYLSGVDVMTAKEQLGHADIQTTLSIYTHLDANHKRRAMDKLDTYLSNASQMQV